MITNKNFYPTFWTQFFGALNDNFFKNALITLFTVKNITFFGLNNIQLIGLASAIFIFPFFLFSSLSAELANKYPKDKLSQKLKIMELVAIVIGLLGVNTHNTLLCMFTLFLLGLQATLYGPIKYSILTELIDESNLTKANSIIEAGTFIGILIGTIGGGIIIQHFDNYYLLNSLAIIFSVIGLLFSLKIPKLFSVDKDQSLNLNVIKQTGKIIKETYKHKNLFMTILGISWFWGLGVFVLTMIPIISKNLFSLEYLPYFLMTFTLGVAIGSILCEKISNHALELGLVPLSSFGMLIGLSLMTLSLVQMNVWFFIISLFIFSVFGGIYSIPLYTFLQLRTSNEERSFYIASNNIINALFMVLFSLGITLLNALHVSIVNMFYYLYCSNNDCVYLYL